MDMSDQHLFHSSFQTVLLSPFTRIMSIDVCINATRIRKGAGWLYGKVLGS